METSKFKSILENFTRKNKRLVTGIIIGFLVAIVLSTSLQRGGVIYNTLYRGDKRIEKEIRSLVEVDDDADLSVLTVADGELLKQINDELFANTSKGDKLVIFENKGVIYREKTGKILNIVTIKL